VVVVAEKTNSNAGKEEMHQAVLKARRPKEPSTVCDNRIALARVVAEVCRREQLHENFSDGFLLEEARGRAVFNGETRDRRLKVLMVSLTRLHKAILESGESPCTLAEIRSAGDEHALHGGGPAVDLGELARDRGEIEQGGDLGIGGELGEAWDFGFVAVHR